MANLLNTTISTQLNVSTVNVSGNIAVGNINVTNLMNVANIDLANGTLTSPSFAFGASQETGIYMPAANVVGIASNGNLTMQIAQTGITVNATMTHNGSVNIVGSLNVTANISNTGNLLVSQNSFTGNLTVVQNTVTGNIIIQTTANVVTLNANGVIFANQTPLVNNVTRVETGLAANTTANVVLSLVPANVMTLTVNEAGMYVINGLILLGANNSGTNVANIGINLSFGGTATIATIKYSAIAHANGNTFTANLGTGTGQNTAVIQAAGAVQTGSLSLSSKANDYILISGYANVSAAGTVNCNIACQNTTNSNANSMPNCFITFTKIG